jgi:hypothetical protein
MVLLEIDSTNRSNVHARELGSNNRVSEEFLEPKIVSFPWFIIFDVLTWPKNPHLDKKGRNLKRTGLKSPGLFSTPKLIVLVLGKSQAKRLVNANLEYPSFRWGPA